mgnify:CR=1 FL=1
MQNAVLPIAGRAAIKSVPPSVREAALALGASPVQAVFHHVLPLAMPGILTGTIIGTAGALGETVDLPTDRHVHVFVARGAGTLQPGGLLTTGDAASSVQQNRIQRMRFCAPEQALKRTGLAENVQNRPLSQRLGADRHGPLGTGRGFVRDGRYMGKLRNWSPPRRQFMPCVSGLGWRKTILWCRNRTQNRCR